MNLRIKKNETLTDEQIQQIGRYPTPGPNSADDGISWSFRPGSWEWQLPHAQDARERLWRAGFAQVVDVDAPWRVQWVATRDLSIRVRKVKP